MDMVRELRTAKRKGPTREDLTSYVGPLAFADRYLSNCTMLDGVPPETNVAI